VKAPPAVPRAAVNWSTPTPRDLSGCFCSGQGSEEYRARSAVLKLATTRDGAYCEHLGFTPQVTEVFLYLTTLLRLISGAERRRTYPIPRRLLSISLKFSVIFVDSVGSDLILI